METVEHKVYSVKKSCRKCYGRGYTGITRDGKKLGCRCLKVMYVKEPVLKPV